jgi:BASS family bile acid:Na+ symporter
VVLVTALSPLLSPLIAEWVAGAAVPLDLPVLIKRLLLLIGGAFAAAAILRLTMGIERINRHKSAFDGVSVLMYFIFAIAAMDGVLAAAIATPGTVALFLLVAFVISGLGFLTAWLLLRPLSPADRFVLGYATGHRNMGLVIAALGAATPDTTFLFFALAQFPIYLMPQIVKPLAGRFRPPPGVAKG